MNRDDNSEWKQQQDEHEQAELAQMVAEEIAWRIREDQLLAQQEAMNVRTQEA